MDKPKYLSEEYMRQIKAEALPIDEGKRIYWQAYQEGALEQIRRNEAAGAHRKPHRKPQDESSWQSAGDSIPLILGAMPDSSVPVEVTVEDEADEFWWEKL